MTRYMYAEDVVPVDVHVHLRRLILGDTDVASAVVRVRVCPVFQQPDAALLNSNECQHRLDLVLTLISGSDNTALTCYPDTAW